MLTCAIIYTSVNDNTRRLAEVMSKALPPKQCIYLGRPNTDALTADVIFWGNNAGDTSKDTLDFLEMAKTLEKIVVPYGNTCYGGGKDMLQLGTLQTMSCIMQKRFWRNSMGAKRKKELVWRGLFYIIGMILLAFGLTLNTKTGLGVAPVLTVPFCISEQFGVDFALATFTLYSVFIILQFILKGKDRKWANILQFPFSIAFSGLLHLFGNIVTISFEDVWRSGALLLAAMAITAVGVSMMVNMELIPNPADGFANTIGAATGRGMGMGKNILDLSCVGITCIICLCSKQPIVGIGVGTLVSMIGVGRCIAVFQKLFRLKMRETAGIRK